MPEYRRKRRKPGGLKTAEWWWNEERPSPQANVPEESDDARVRMFQRGLLRAAQSACGVTSLRGNQPAGLCTKAAGAQMVQHQFQVAPALGSIQMQTLGERFQSLFGTIEVLEIACCFQLDEAS